MTDTTSNVAVAITWSAAQNVSAGLGGGLLLPKVQSLPGLYRVWLGEESGTTWIHVGESVDLARALAQLARPVAPASVAARLAARIQDTLSGSGMVSIATATTVVAEVDGSPATVDLVRGADRRLALSAALVAARFDGADRILDFEAAD